jgi:hypothetical protein
LACHVLLCGAFAPLLSIAPFCVVRQANADCHAAFDELHALRRELHALRRERDRLSLELVEARSRYDTAWKIGNRQTSQEAGQPTNEPITHPARADDALPGHANGVLQSFTTDFITHAVPGKAAKSSSASRASRGGPSRSLQQAESDELHCSEADVKALSAVAPDVSKARAIVANMRTTNAGCALCLEMCAKYDYRIGCLFRCQHQRENQCTNTSKIASQIPKATLQDRRLLVSMIEQVSSSCAYCIIETVESVGGTGFVHETMHITTDYPILPRPCLPALADILRSKPRAPHLPIDCTVRSRVTATAEADGEGIVQLHVPASASPLDVACILAERFRPAEGDARPIATTLVVPTGMGPITMLADLIVNPGETVRIEAGTRATLVVGERQLQVKNANAPHTGAVFTSM